MERITVDVMKIQVDNKNLSYFALKKQTNKKLPGCRIHVLNMPYSETLVSMMEFCCL